MMSTAATESESQVSSHIAKLARILALNHAFTTLPKPHSEWSNVIEPPSDEEKEQRVIAVVGAGASMAAGLKGTVECWKDILEKLTPYKPLYEQELDRLELEYRLDREDFETKLLAASQFNRQAVLDTLRNLYSQRFLPTLTYELLAHMLKHRFLDAIINFNFDELLDQSIEDELGKGTYDYVLSDGDCPPDVAQPSSPTHFSHPVYVKPHGSVSHSSTMRFTRGDYFRLPSGIHELHKRLLTGPVTLLVVGFNMQSFEFNQILANRLKDCPESAVYNLTLENDRVPRFAEKDKKVLEALYSRGGHIPVDSPGHTLHSRMKSLWDEVRGLYKVPFIPRGVLRHELVCSICPQVRSTSGITEGERVYLHDRAFMEAAFAVAQTKGFVTTPVLMKGRTGRYFQLSKANLPRATDGPFPSTLAELCEKLKLERELFHTLWHTSALTV